jgi:glycosyltransferase involved in cell wall biosynthesis
MDTQILRKCDKFTVATQQILDEYLSIVPELKAKATVILNGYDEDDFLNIVPVKYSSFTFLYMGKIYDYKRSPIPLLEAFKNCCEKTQFQMIHIGTIPGNTLKKIKDTYGFYQFLGYKSHNEALNMAAGADVLIVIVNNDVQSKGVITGKVFEYIKLSKPILAICPKGGILEIMINQYNLGIAVPPDDEPGIITAIQKIINYSIHSMDDSVYKFSREFQAKQLRDVCEDI